MGFRVVENGISRKRYIKPQRKTWSRSGRSIWKDYIGLGYGAFSVSDFPVPMSVTIERISTAFIDEYFEGRTSRGCAESGVLIMMRKNMQG